MLWRTIVLILCLIVSMVQGATPLFFAFDNEAAAQPGLRQTSRSNNALLVVDQFLGALRRGEAERAYKNFTAQGFQEVNDWESFQNFIKNYSLLESVTPVLRLESSSPPEGHATVVGEFPIKGGTATLTTLVIDQAGIWKILALDIFLPKILQKPKDVVTAAPSLPENSKPQLQAAEPEKPAAQTLRSSTEEYARIAHVVSQFLDNLKSPDFSVAYQFYMSKGFQQTTSYADFKKLMQRLPILATGSFKLSTPQLIEPNYAGLLVEVTGPYGHATLKFILSHTTEGWKIHSLEIAGASSPAELPTGTAELRPPALTSFKEIDSQNPENPIQAQLFWLKNGDVNGSYLELTAPEFQRATTMQEYENFINSYPLLRQNPALSVTQQDVKGEVATLKVTLSAPSGETLSLHYDLVQKEGHWKILNIEVIGQYIPPKPLGPALPQRGQDAIRLAPEPATMENGVASPAVVLPPQTPPGDLTISYGVFGTSVNEGGLIQTPTLTIPKGKESVYFNLYVENARKGDPLTIDFQHLKSGVAIPQIRSQVKADGSSTMSYIFAPPPEGWPEGIYRVTVSGPKGQSKAFNFRVQ